MTKAEKILERMRNNPRDWSIEDLKVIAKRYGIDWRQPGTSHVTFAAMGAVPLTVPAHKPIKPIYVTRFLTMVDNLRASNED
jgi:hypothetical protein